MYREPASAFGVPWHATRLGKLSLLTVGDPLHEPGGATTLTDKRRGEYRLLSIRDERLVGYLSLGATQPDGLTIKRIIDEGLCIREVANALLTGKLDARRYFAQQHAHAAYRMAATGEFAVPSTPLPLSLTSPEKQATRNTEPLLPTPMLSEQQALLRSSSQLLMDEPTACSSADACADGILHLKRTPGNRDAVLSGAGRAYTPDLDLALSFNDGCWTMAGQTAIRTPAPLSKARKAILDVLHEHERSMKAKEIALALGKRDGTVRKMLCEMKASHLIEETEQGYRVPVSKEEQTAEMDFITLH